MKRMSFGILLRWHRNTREAVAPLQVHRLRNHQSSFLYATPIKESCKLFGSERVFESNFVGRRSIVKERFSKKYRHPTLDSKLALKRLNEINKIFVAYRKSSKQWSSTLNKLAQVRQRGRKRTMVG